MRDAGGEADIMRGEGQTIWVRMMIMMMRMIMMNTMMISEVQKLAILSLFTLVKNRQESIVIINERARIPFWLLKMDIVEGTPPSVKMAKARCPRSRSSN